MQTFSALCNTQLISKYDNNTNTNNNDNYRDDHCVDDDYDTTDLNNLLIFNDNNFCIKREFVKIMKKRSHIRMNRYF